MKRAKTDTYAPVFALRPQVWLLISTLLYFFPFVVGSFHYQTPSGGHEVEYHSSTIYAVVLGLVSVVLSLFIQNKRLNLTVSGDFRHEQIAIVAFVAIFGIYTLLTPGLFEAQKLQVLETTNRFHYVFYDACEIGLVYAAILNWKKNRLLFFLSLCGLLLVLYIGQRSAIAVAIAGLFYVKFRNRSLLTVNPLHVIAGLCAVLFLAVYKSIYVAVKMGDFAAVQITLLQNPLLNNALVGLEQFVVFAHLDFVVANNYSLPCSDLLAAPVALIPFSDSVVDLSSCAYNANIQQIFFPGFSGGVAANIWAEFFANFGYAGIPLVVVTIVGMCSIVEHFLSTVRSPLMKSGFVLAIIELTVYVQRKELIGAIISAKRVIIVAFLMYALAAAVRSSRATRPHVA